VELDEEEELLELDDEVVVELEEDVLVEELTELLTWLEELLELVEGIGEEGPLDDGTDGMLDAFAQPTIKMLRSVTPNKFLLFFKMISPY
jgi:hypothetical protein